MVYHFLPEAEHFSEYTGGAVSRWVANVVRNDPETHIVCSSADETWGFSSERIHLAPAIRNYLNYRARRFYPPQVSGPLLRGFFGADLPKFQKGDVVWVHGVPALAEALSRQIEAAGAKLVFHLHSSAFAQHSRYVLERLKSRAHLIVFCSDFLRRQASQRFPDLVRTATLYGGADGDMFHPPSSRAHTGPTRILFASRLVPQKGLHVLLEAMRLIEHRGMSATLQVFGASSFGGSPTTQYMRSLQKSLPKNVTFRGYKSGWDLAHEYRACDIFCLPSVYEEPFGMVLVEALACGLPLVASRVGGIPEIVSDGSGILVPPSDPEQLALALERYSTSSELRARAGTAGNLLFRKKFTWQCIRDDYAGLLGTL